MKATHAFDLATLIRAAMPACGVTNPEDWRDMHYTATGVVQTVTYRGQDYKVTVEPVNRTDQRRDSVR